MRREPPGIGRGRESKNGEGNGMRMVDLIQKKRRGEAHTKEEIQHIIRGFTQGEIPDYQMSAWMMAVCFQGMTPRGDRRPDGGHVAFGGRGGSERPARRQAG